MLQHGFFYSGSAPPKGFKPGHRTNICRDLQTRPSVVVRREITSWSLIRRALAPVEAKTIGQYGTSAS